MDLSLELLVSKQDRFRFKAWSKLLREGKKNHDWEEKRSGSCVFEGLEIAARPLMASLQLFSRVSNERKKCALSPSKPQLLASLGFPLNKALPKGPAVGGWLRRAPGGPLGTWWLLLGLG